MPRAGPWGNRSCVANTQVTRRGFWLLAGNTPYRRRYAVAMPASQAMGAAAPSENPRSGSGLTGAGGTLQAEQSGELCAGPMGPGS